MVIISQWLILYLISTRKCNPTRHIAQFVTTDRRIGGIRRISSQERGSRVVHGNMEMDSHADTIVCGANCAIIHYTGKECDVSPYTDAYEAIKSVPIVQAGTAYDNVETGETFIFVFNEAIWMGDKMDNTLVNPNQLRSFGITVQDNPFDTAPTYV
jgi:hypothetical protein